MWRTMILLVFCLASLTLANHATAAGVLRIDESTTRVLIESHKLGVFLSLENSTSNEIAAHVKVELLDPRDRVRATAASQETIPPGSTMVQLPIALAVSTLSKESRGELLWYRLRYEVIPSNSISAIKGTLSLSEITPSLFELRVAISRSARANSRLRATVRAMHPAHLGAVSGVALSGRIDWDQKRILQASATTDSEGYALLDFDLPASTPKDDIQIKVIGTLGGLTVEAEDEIELDSHARILTSTDKPLYQPGQTLHARALVFDSSNRAVANHDVTLRITDPDNTPVFRAVLKTSRFGVASADWQIPANARLGQYSVLVEVDDPLYRQSTGGQYISVSRYDLPNFAVSVKPDRSYYLPNQTAEVEVRAEYLFGQPVERGHARVVRETQREWNFREQKWETEEGDKYEGNIEDGRFIARIKLADVHKDLAHEDYSRSRDIAYAAYITDPTTNRTEQRRFLLRATKEPIHVYVSKGNAAEGFLLRFYLSTFYADGTPAQCDVEIADASSRRLRTIRTNRYGLAKITELRLPPTERIFRSSYSAREATLVLTARDAGGQIGHHSENFWLGYDNRPVVRADTNKTLFRAGEPIEVMIAASVPDLSLVVEASCNSRVISTRIIKLRNGQALMTIPYSTDFTGEVTIAAYSNGADREGIAGAQTVLYPRDRALKLDVKIGQAIYKPGEEARADFRVRTPDGRAVESALGVVVLDRAVEERSRANQEFGSASGFHGTFLSNDRLAGITRKDLDRIDLSKPLPEGLELVAEILLNRDEGYWLNFFGESDYEIDQSKIYGPLTDAQVKPIKEALATRYDRTSEYPSTEDALRQMLADVGIDLEAIRDPWGTSYLASFSIENRFDVLEIISAGADKRIGSPDDFTVARITRPYFRQPGEVIGRALAQHHLRTAGYIRDVSALERELAREGVNLNELRDRWGRPYVFEFGVEQYYFTVNVKSGGPNLRFDQAEDPAPDDFIVWTARIDFFEPTRARLEEAITNYVKATSRFPQSEGEFAGALKHAGMNGEALRDAWGYRCYVSLKTEDRFASHTITQSYAKYRATPRLRTEVVPITQQMNFIYVRSVGADGKIGTSDDFTLATLSSVAGERFGKDTTLARSRDSVARTGATGAITGSIVDTMDAVIVGTKITATHTGSSRVYYQESDSGGRYVLRNLPAGMYEVRFEAMGFRSLVFTDVPVSSSNVTELNASLTVGGTVEVVTVSAGGGSFVQTEAASVSGTLRNQQVKSLPLNGRGYVNVVTRTGGSAQMSTPRLREYFPETLLWQPSLETDAQGSAQLKFRLGDNITTWKVGVIASTVDGQIGIAEQELRAFQPFFVEHDPPRILTEGDEIMLPVVLRNYLEKTQAVDVEMKPESWFTALSRSRQRVEVAGNAAQAVFGFRAVAPITDGRQRISATSPAASDAIEKRVSVHPNGEEITETASTVFSSSSTMEVNIPEGSISGSTTGELKIYPNLMAHVVEGVEAIMRRPYGCGEQTISSTYPSLIVLRHYKSRGEDFPPSAQKARRYLQAGYERLLNYRSDDGGFTYWGRGEPNSALSAYALRFLNDASDLIDIDQDMIDGARSWLIKHQSANGSWTDHYRSGRSDSTGSPALTAYIARVLAGIAKRDRARKVTDAAAVTQTQATTLALKRALDYLGSREAGIDDPYSIALYALAAVDAGQADAATPAINRLRNLARDEGSASYWSLDTNTPFYGWGLAGRIETTALVVQALAGDCRLGNADCRLATAHQSQSQKSAGRDAPLINRGLTFLLQHKDRFGVWLSTQATVNVMDALAALLLHEQSASPQTSAPAEIFVNSRRAASITMPPASQLSNPIVIELSPFLSPGRNRVEIRRDHTTPASAQFVASYYSPWTISSGARQANASPELRFRVTFDKNQAKVGDEITCAVEIDRMPGTRGHGMLLAEIGLPPGADVDRASLDRAVKEIGRGVDHYDILPDRVVIYLWPQTGGTRFQFKFRPRFGLAAQTAPSVVYDYYNPEARAIVAPTRFIVK